MSQKQTSKLGWLEEATLALTARSESFTSWPLECGLELKVASWPCLCPPSPDLQDDLLLA